MAWFTAPSGATCVAAYDAVGAASLADSYANEANPGTYDAAPGVAPTWAYGTGWTFNGSTQYLTTGINPATDQSWSWIVRYSGATIAAGASSPLGVFAAATRRFGVSMSTSARNYWNGGQLIISAAGDAAAVLAGAGATAYRNSSAEAGSIPAWGGATVTPYIGARNRADLASVDAFFNGSIQALAIYSGTLTLADVVAITAAMNALPAAAAAKGLPVIEHWHNTMYLR